MTNNDNGPDIWEPVEMADLLNMADNKENQAVAGFTPEQIAAMSSPLGVSVPPIPNLHLIDFTVCKTLEELTQLLSYMELMVDADQAPEWVIPYLKKAD